VLVANLTVDEKAVMQCLSSRGLCTVAICVCGPFNSHVLFTWSWSHLACARRQSKLVYKHPPDGSGSPLHRSCL
jgi:hypothetical protein